MKLLTTSASFILGLGLAVAAAGCGNHRNTTAANNSPSATDTTGTADRTDNSASRTGAADLSTADRDFMMNAAQGGMTEVELGRLAQDHGSSQAVKDFGKKLVDDHTQANDKLKSIANDVGVTLPTSLDAKHQADVDKLSKLSGANFDRQFMKHAVSDHKHDINEFQKEADNGQNQQVKDFASNTLPTLKDHLQTAENWRSGKGGTSADRSQ